MAKPKFTPDMKQFIIEHRNMENKAAFALFSKTYPEVQSTYYYYCSLKNKLGATRKIQYQRNLPVMTEIKKRGYIWIKTPDHGWQQKAKWVWCTAHPEYWDIPKIRYFHKDGNKANCNIENILPIEEHLLIRFINAGGIDPQFPSNTTLHYLQAKMSYAQVSLEVEIDEAVIYTQKNGKTSRLNRQKIREQATRYRDKHRDDEEYKQHRRELQKKYREHRTPEQKEKMKLYQKKWKEKKKLQNANKA